MEHDERGTEPAGPQVGSGAPGAAHSQGSSAGTEPSLLAELSSIEAPVGGDPTQAVETHALEEPAGEPEEDAPRRRVGLLTKVVVLGAVWVLLVVFLVGRFHSDNSTPANARLDQASGNSGADDTGDAGAPGDDASAVAAGDPSAQGAGAVGPDGMAVASPDGGSVLAGSSGEGSGGSTTANGGGGTSGEAQPGTLPGGSTTTTVKNGTPTSTTTTTHGGGTTTTTEAGGSTTTTPGPPQAITIVIASGPTFTTPDGTVVADGGRVTFSNTSGGRVYLSADGDGQQALENNGSLGFDITGPTTFRLYSKTHALKATLVVQTA